MATIAGMNINSIIKTDCPVMITSVSQIALAKMVHHVKNFKAFIICPPDVFYLSQLYKRTIKKVVRKTYNFITKYEKELKEKIISI